MPIQTLSTEDVAGLLGLAPKTFLNRLRKLVDTDGFPARLPGGRWYEPAIAAWMARTSGMEPEITGDTVIDLQRRIVEQHYTKGRAA